MSIHVQLERFEGPLGLLLHLIREQEMDIFNINIHHITRQYLDYIRAMRRLDLEVAGEFVAMAATLLHIKSRMLLPQYNEEGEVVANEDPRKELVQKLIEYKRFKELSHELARRAWLGRDVFTRGEREVIEPEVAESELVLEENPLFSLIASYRAALRNMKRSVHKVAGELQSIASRILEMRPKLIIGQRVVFRDFITAGENMSNQVLVTFLSLLELAKMGLVSVFQSEPFADIHIETKHEVDNNAVSKAENYDAVNSDLKAEEIIHDAALSLDEPVSGLEGEDESVVEAAVTDAASDDEIAAEESRLFGAAEGTPAPDPARDAAADDALNAAEVSGFVDANALSETEAHATSTDTEAHATSVDTNTPAPEVNAGFFSSASELDFIENESPSESLAAELIEPPLTPESSASNEFELAALNSEPEESEFQSSEPVSDLNDSKSVDEPNSEGMEAISSAADESNVDLSPETIDMALPSEEGASLSSKLETAEKASASELTERLPAPEMVAAAVEAPSVAQINQTKSTTGKSERENISSALSAAFSAFDAFEDIPTPPTPVKPPEVNE